MVYSRIRRCYSKVPSRIFHIPADRFLSPRRASVDRAVSASCHVFGKETISYNNSVERSVPAMRNNLHITTSDYSILGCAPVVVVGREFFCSCLLDERHLEVLFGPSHAARCRRGLPCCLSAGRTRVGVGIFPGPRPPRSGGIPK